MRYPNRKLLAMCALAVVSLTVAPSWADTQASIAPREQGTSQIGYDNVADALKSLSAAPDMTKRTSKTGWTEFVDTKNDVVWSFVPANHTGYPAVFRRSVVHAGLGMSVDMQGICEATEAACRKLMKELKKQNEIVQTQLFKLPPHGAGAAADLSPFGSLLEASTRY